MILGAESDQELTLGDWATRISQDTRVFLLMVTMGLIITVVGCDRNRISADSTRTSLSTEDLRRKELAGRWGQLLPLDESREMHSLAYTELSLREDGTFTSVGRGLLHPSDEFEVVDFVASGMWRLAGRMVILNINNSQPPSVKERLGTSKEYELEEVGTDLLLADRLTNEYFQQNALFDWERNCYVDPSGRQINETALDKRDALLAAKAEAAGVSLERLRGKSFAEMSEEELAFFRRENKRLVELMNDAQKEAASKQGSGPTITPRGSSTMVGRWGRDWALMTADGMAKVGYAEFHFLADGTFKRWGYNFGERFEEAGVYRLDDDSRLILQLTSEWKGGRKVANLSEAWEAELFYESGGAMQFRSVLHFYRKGAIWNFERERYEDELGRPYQVVSSHSTDPGEVSRKADEERKECAEKLSYHRRRIAQTGGTEGAPGEFACPSPPYSEFRFDAASKTIRCEFHRH